MRKLATVRRIDQIRTIPDSDRLAAYRVGGWWVVDQKDAYKEGDLVVYLEIDSWVPTQLASFLSRDKEPREYMGIKGERLRTVRLRGQVSQGLILPVDRVDSTGAPFINGYFLTEPGGVFVGVEEGQDVSEAWHINKWEPPAPTQLSGDVVGNFPSFIPKTDQERVQNLQNEVAEWKQTEIKFEVTEKLDGSSMTVYDYKQRDHQGVCSRNLELKEGSSTYWAVAKQLDILTKIQGRGIAVQGELIGEGIQGNKYKLKGHKFVVFDIYDIENQMYFNPASRRKLCEELGLEHVPVLHEEIIVDVEVEDILRLAEGKSQLFDTEREGLVFKGCINPSVSFKAISNKFLLKSGD